MKFSIRFAICNRFGRAVSYNLREFCISIVDRYTLTNTEVQEVVELKIGETFENDDFMIKRIA